jgi:hypothetical protein
MTQRSMSDSGVRDELDARLLTLTADLPRRWGHMTVHQMVCHLNDAFKVAMSERDAASLDNLLTRTLVRWLALNGPMRWPHGLPTMPEVDQQIDSTKPIAFERNVAELRRTMTRFAGTPRDFEWGRHPAFGAMTGPEWLRWGYLHCDHHFRQFGA